MFYFVFARTVDVLHGNTQLACNAYVTGPTAQPQPKATKDIEFQWRRFNSVVGAKHACNKINKAGHWL